MGRRRSSLLLVVAASLVVLLAQPAAAAEQIGPSLMEIKAPQAWSRGARGANVSVAIVSSGIGEHEDLAGKVGAGFAVGGGDARSDSSGRGTHLAGIVGAATGNGIGIAGVARDAKVLPYKAFDSESATGDGYVDALSRAGSARPTVVLVDVPDGYTDFPKLRDGMKKLGEAGISVVVGAQGGLSVDDLPVLAVAATGTGSSRVGPRGVAAPGGSILSTKPALLPTDPLISEYEARSGTGQAAAHVAGAVAILRGIGANPTQAADFLRSTARKGDASLGAGSIDVAAAVTAFKTPPPTTTTTKAKPETPSTTAPATGTGFGTAPPSGPTGPAVLSGETDGLGTDEPAVVPPGADELSQSETGGPSILIGGKERPWGMLTVGFGLLFGVGTALSITFRRLADAAI